MASKTLLAKKYLVGILLIVVFIITIDNVCCNPQHFKVGGEHGWIIPSANQTRDFFNQWADNLKFCVNDTLYFKHHKNESVLQVNQLDYENCNSLTPINKFGGETATTIKLQDCGCTYFITNSSSHCKAGLKMTVFVFLYKTDHFPLHDPWPPWPWSSPFGGFRPTLGMPDHSMKDESCMLGDWDVDYNITDPRINSYTNQLSSFDVTTSAFMFICYIIVTNLVY